MFIQVIQGKVSDAEGLRGAMDRWGRDLQPGATGRLGTTGGITDDGTFVATVRFESEEAARRNSERPEQGAWWTGAEKCFDGPVTFFDCHDVDVWMDGGSDDAGFVQVMEGHTSDSDRMREMMRRYADDMHALRPEIIGATIALHGDGAFVETVYFTSEEEARQRENMAPPPEMAQITQEEQQLMDNVTYLDLHQPWLVSPALVTRGLSGQPMTCRRYRSGSVRNDRQSRTSDSSAQGDSRIPQSPSSNTRAPGIAATCGECVAIIACARPPRVSSCSMPTSARHPENDSADSGSSSTYKPSPENRSEPSSARNDSPCDISWKSGSGVDPGWSSR